MKIISLSPLSFYNIFKRKLSCRVLLYHRVANVKDDPYLLSVSPDNFKNQIEWLKKNVNVIPIMKLVKQISTGEIKSYSFCITFDDGYADNFYNALPILRQFKVPATIFVTSGMINKKEPFCWDENTCKEDRGRALRSTELIKLAKEPLIDIGSHTITHPYLSRLDLKDQKKEIFQSKINLENILHKKISGFSYPFGTKRDYNEETIELVKNAGYNYACSNIPKKVNIKSQIYSLSRFLVRNWSIKEFEIKFRRF